MERKDAIMNLYVLRAALIQQEETDTYVEAIDLAIKDIRACEDILELEKEWIAQKEEE